MTAIAEAPVAPAPRRFGPGRVVGRALAATVSNALGFFTLALVLAGGPTALTALGIRLAPVEPENPFSMFGPLFFFGLALYFICGVLLQGALIHGAARRFSGGKASLGDCIAAGVRSLLPILAIALLMWLALAIGLFGWATGTRALIMSGLLYAGAATPFAPLVTLIVVLAPASFFLTVWAVVAPAVVVERAGAFAAFSRSWTLTRKSRRAIFLLGVALAVFSAILFVLSIFLAGAVSATGLDNPSSRRSDGSSRRRSGP